MLNPFLDIRGMEFFPLSEVKAKLSALMRLIIGQKKRMVVTTNGRPTAVIVAYDDYLSLMKTSPFSESAEEGRVIDLDDWRRDRKKRLAVRDSILRLFNPDQLSRKGKKKYKQDLLRGLSR